MCGRSAAAAVSSRRLPYPRSIVLLSPPDAPSRRSVGRRKEPPRSGARRSLPDRPSTDAERDCQGRSRPPSAPPEAVAFRPGNLDCLSEAEPDAEPPRDAEPRNWAPRLPSPPLTGRSVDPDAGRPPSWPDRPVRRWPVPPSRLSPNRSPRAEDERPRSPLRPSCSERASSRPPPRTSDCPSLRAVRPLAGRPPVLDPRKAPSERAPGRPSVDVPRSPPVWLPVRPTPENRSARSPRSSESLRRAEESGVADCRPDFEPQE